MRYSSRFLLQSESRFTTDSWGIRGGGPSNGVIFVGTLLLVVFLRGVLEEDVVVKLVDPVLDGDGLVTGGVVGDEGVGKGGNERIDILGFCFFFLLN